MQVYTPSPHEQKAKIEGLCKVPLQEECFMISKSWWESWHFYVQYATESTQPPDQINNLELVEMYGDYKEQLDNIHLNLNEFHDWTQMKLKKDIKEGRDFILVSQGVWKELHNWYNGGPCIPISIYGNANGNAECGIENADLSPIVIPIEVMTGDEVGQEQLGLLISKKATGEYLYKRVEEMLRLSESPIELKLRSPIGGGLRKVMRDKTTLDQYGDFQYSTVLVFEALENKIGGFAEDEKMPLRTPPKTTGIKRFQPDVGFTDQFFSEDEMLRAALESSLAEMKGSSFFPADLQIPPVEEEKESGLMEIERDRGRAREVEHNREGSPGTEKKVKTPSTGEGTPGRRYKFLQEDRDIVLTENNYQNLAQHIESRSSHLHDIQREREFDDKIEEELSALQQPRILFSEKSSSTILQELVELEENCSIDTGKERGIIDPKDSKMELTSNILLEKIE